MTAAQPAPAADARALAEALRAQARAEGFAAMGVCRPDAVPEAAERLRAFLAAGRHGEMAWMAERAAWRGSAAALWPEARSVVMLAEPYQPDPAPWAPLTRPELGVVSCYARGKDYHDLVKKRLKRLGRWLIERAGGQIKVFVDTAPVMEKPLAAAAGLGWQGKHTNLVSRELGSWFFLGAIFTTLELPADAPAPQSCGSCRRCLDVCPTAAFPAPFQLDARRCISYLTIELKGPIPRPMRPLLGNRIYGCDDCLAVCPWNKFAGAAAEIGYLHRPELTRPRLAELAALDDGTFREVFSGSPVKRIGRGRFVRNVLVAIGNSGDRALADSARALLGDADPLVRGAAVWALGRLVGARALAELGPPPDERDPQVLDEWRAACAPACGLGQG
ncbi:tRNA epoxyqueuosine(34) reductase QueG [Oceanicella actignis]|uniref:tRNA epoxyqueuosine(34) reductase QueG n=1 Tax=Oceanicella actignis TaxID=1189325 RepID=UPI0011E77D38|nr:tRNA epoxyqueuosine(34) reductase QueG [Oceanicella actignis]TYO89096.1 epoxyqueuosine reductase [Oceanicella actignis]